MRSGILALAILAAACSSDSASPPPSDPTASAALLKKDCADPKWKEEIGKREAKLALDSAFAKPIDVPPPGEAGGYEHERHKQNYREMELAGVLYAITGEARYARFVRDMLEKYAVLYPTLGAHPLARNQAPGKLFHQSLNEANWLLATAIA